MASRFILPFADVGSGIKPSSGARLFFYETGTNTFRNTFTDQAATTPNANPVIADSNGVFSNIFIDGTYKVILQNTNSTQIWEADPVVSLVSVGNEINIFENIALMKAAPLSLGNTVLCNRFYNGGDLVEGLLFDIQSSGTDNNYDHELDNGLFAILINNKNIVALQAGILPDYNVEAQTGTDYTATIQALNDAGIKMSFDNYIRVSSITNYKQDLFTSKQGFSEGSRFPSLQPEPQSYELELPAPYFDWFTYKTFYNQSGFGYCDLRKEDLKPASTNKYYVGFSGASNSNDGLTVATSKETITATYAITGADVISIAPGRHFRPLADYSLTLDKDIQIICEHGRAELVSGDDLTWTVNATYSNVYQATRSSLQDTIPCFDSSFVDSNGDYLEMTEVASILLVSTTPNSWYSDGSIVYVRTLDDRVADSNILVIIIVNSTTTGNGFTVYFENIDFVCHNNIHRSNPATGAGTRDKIVAANCTFKYSSAVSGISGGSGGFRTEGAESYLFNCTTAKNKVDGFNYHSYDANTPIAFEVDCIGRNNGHPSVADNANQGTTIHQGGSIIRVNGNYYGNKGPSMADVGIGCSSFNVGSYFYNSESTVNPRSMDFFASATDGTDYMRGWLIGVKSTGGTFDLNIPSKAGGLPQCIIRSYKSQVSRNAGDGSGIVQYYPFVD